MSSLPQPVVESTISSETRAEPGLLRRAWRWLSSFVIGAFCCQFLPTAFLSLGWMLAIQRRSFLQGLHRRSPSSEKGVALADAVAGSELEEMAAWPAWLHRRGPGFRVLGRNLMRGLRGFVHVLLLTLPGTALWAFSWRAGWENSFHKGYELASMGPLLGWLGLLLFALALWHLPLAQARLSLTEDWSVFWQLRLQRRLLGTRPTRVLLLSAAWVVAGLPLLLLRVVPTFLENPEWAPAGMTAKQAEDLLGLYFLVIATWVMAAATTLKWLAGRLHATLLVDAVASGRVGIDELHPREQDALRHLDLDGAPEHEDAPTLVRVARATGGRAWRLLHVGGLLLLGLAFGIQVYVAQFFVYVPLLGWLNHPLVQLPWFRYAVGS
ncbi:MAG: hypothetical protein AAF533_10190 [Acidobacteriota bacterium]